MASPLHWYLITAPSLFISLCRDNGTFVRRKVFPFPFFSPFLFLQLLLGFLLTFDVRRLGGFSLKFQWALGHLSGEPARTTAGLLSSDICPKVAQVVALRVVLGSVSRLMRGRQEKHTFKNALCLFFDTERETTWKVIYYFLILYILVLEE